MTAPATGRTADENEMREGIAKTIYEAFPIYCDNPRPKCAVWPWHVPPSATSHDRYYALADRLLSGPLAPILQEAATARKERDEARRDHDALAQRWKMNPSLIQHRIAAAEQEAATLRARLQEAEKADDFWREVLEGSSARWREAAMMAVSGDMRRLQRLLDAKPIAGSATPVPQTQEAGDHEPR